LGTICFKGLNFIRLVWVLMCEQDKDFITKAGKDDGISPYTDAIGERMEYQLYH